MVTATLVDSILKTRIVTRDDVDACQPSTGTPVSDEQVVQALVEQGRLTAWQLQNIRAGHVNFTLDHGKYLILDQIGVGGMDAVYRARHLGMNTERAVKVIDPRRVSDPLLVERFKREVQVCSQLDHENIVRAYDVGSQGGGLFLVLEYVAGADLFRIVRRDGPMSCEEATAIIMQAACGLAYAHGKGVVHRDIKPGNILLSASGVVKILDMGLARIVEEHDPERQKELTRDGEVMGTVAYMPAEQARNARDADHRSDIYSLGATLYSLLTGHTPYGANGHFEIISQLVTGKFTPIGTYRSDLPEGLQLVVHRMLAHRPEDRYQAASDIVRELTPFAATQLAGRPVVTSSMQAVAEQVEATVAVEQSDVFAAQTAAESGAVAPVAVRTETVASGGSLADTEAFALANQSLFSMANVTQHRRKRDNSKWIAISTLVAACLATAVFVAVRVSRPDKTTTVAKPGVVKDQPVKNGPPPTDMRISYDGHLAPIWSVAWSPDSAMLATGGVDATVLVWLGPNVQMRYEEHEAAVISLEWGPRGEYIASVDIRGNIDVWDTTRGTRTRRITRSPHTARGAEDEQLGIVGVGLHPGIKEVAVNSGPRVQRWRISDGELIGEIKASCAQLKYSASGQLLAGCSRSGELHVWQISGDGTTEPLLHLPETGRLHTFRFVDGERLAIVTESGIEFWETGWSEPRQDITFPDDVQELGYRFMQISGDGKKYLFAHKSSVTLIDSTDGTRETFPSPDKPGIFRHAFTDSLDYMLFANLDAAAVRIRDSHRALAVPAMARYLNSQIRTSGGALPPRCVPSRQATLRFWHWNLVRTAPWCCPHQPRRGNTLYHQAGESDREDHPNEDCSDSRTAHSPPGTA